MNPELKAMLPDERRRNAAEVGGNRTARIDFTPEELAEFAALIAERCAAEIRPPVVLNVGEVWAEICAENLHDLATRWRSVIPSTPQEEK